MKSANMEYPNVNLYAMKLMEQLERRNEEIDFLKNEFKILRKEKSEVIKELQLMREQKDHTEQQLDVYTRESKQRTSEMEKLRTENGRMQNRICKMEEDFRKKVGNLEESFQKKINRLDDTIICEKRRSSDIIKKLKQTFRAKEEEYSNEIKKGNNKVEEEITRSEELLQYVNTLQQDIIQERENHVQCIAKMFSDNTISMAKGILRNRITRQQNKKMFKDLCSSRQECNDLNLRMTVAEHRYQLTVNDLKEKWKVKKEIFDKKIKEGKDREDFLQTNLARQADDREDLENEKGNEIQALIKKLQEVTEKLSKVEENNEKRERKKTELQNKFSLHEKEMENQLLILDGHVKAKLFKCLPCCRKVNARKVDHYVQIMLENIDHTLLSEM